METTLDDFMALNDQLAALTEAGIPLDVNLGRGNEFAPTLERINAVVARRVSQGASLTEALQREDRVVTPSYRALMQLGLAAGDPTAALNASTRLAQSADEVCRAAARSLIYPLVICGLAYFGMVGFCLFLLPTLEGMYQGARLPPGLGLRMLQFLRTTLPFWIAIPLFCLLLFLVWMQLRGSRAGSRLFATGGAAWLPGMAHVIAQQRSAKLAESIATLLERGRPLDEALRISAGAWDDPRQEEAVNALSAKVASGQELTDDSAAAMRLPPLLRYALCRADASVGRASALRMAADVYRASASDRLDRLQFLAPLVLCVAIGGVVTLLYGLSLFLPVVEMLRGLAN